MTINERIKLLRKKKGLNQKQFASLIGITQSGASYMEQPGNNVSDSSIKTICTVCGVNEEWLRNDKEPMFVEQDTFSLDEYAKRHGATELELQVIRVYFDLEANTREMLIDHFTKGLAASTPATVEKEKTVEELEEEYKKSRSGTAQNMVLSASNTTADTDGNDKKEKASGQ